MCILAIDIDMAALKQLTEYLKTAFPGCKIMPFQNPMQAVKYAHDNIKEIKAVFTALLMRPIDGLQIMRLMRQRGACFAAFVTAQTDTWELRELSCLNGANGYLPKPLTAEKIISVAAEFINTAQQHN